MDVEPHTSLVEEKKSYVCPVDAHSTQRILPENGKELKIFFAPHSWSLQNYKQILDYAKSLSPGMSVTVRAYAHTVGGITEKYAEKRIENVILFLERGNAALDFIPEIVYSSSQRELEVIPQKSRIHEKLDTALSTYEYVLIEQSSAMQKHGLWAALQNYSFPLEVSLLSENNNDCGKKLEDIDAKGNSILKEGITDYIHSGFIGKTLVISTDIPQGLEDILADAGADVDIEVLTLQDLDNSDALSLAESRNEKDIFSN